MGILLLSLFLSFFISYYVFKRYGYYFFILAGVILFGLFTGSVYLFQIMTPLWVVIFLLPIIATVLVDKHFIQKKYSTLDNVESTFFEERDKYKNIFIFVYAITVITFTAYHVLAPLEMGYDGSSYWIFMVDNSLRMIQSVAILSADSYPPEMMAKLPVISHSMHYHNGAPAIGTFFAELLNIDPATAYLKYSTPLIVLSSIFVLFLLVGYYKSWYAASIVAAICLLPNFEMLLQVAYKLPGSFIVSLFNDESTFDIWVNRALGYEWPWTYGAELLDGAKAAVVQGVGLFLALYMLFGRIRAKVYFLALSPFLLMMNSRFILPIVLIIMWQIIIYILDKKGRGGVYIVLGLFSGVFAFTVYVLNYNVFDFLVVQRIELKDIHPVSLISIVLIYFLQIRCFKKEVSSKNCSILISYALSSIFLLVYLNTFKFNLVSSQLLTYFDFNHLVLDTFSTFTLQMSLFLFIYYFTPTVVSWGKYYSAIIGFLILFGVGKTFGMVQNLYYLNTDLESVHQSVDFINYYNCLDTMDRHSVIVQNSQVYPSGNTGFDVSPERYAAFYYMLGHKEAKNAKLGISLISNSKSTKAEVISYLNNNQVDYVVIDKRFHSPSYFSNAVTYENDECRVVNVSKLPN